MKKDRKDNVVTVRLDNRLSDKVDIKCEDRQLSKSDYIRELIELDIDMKHNSEE